MAASVRWAERASGSAFSSPASGYTGGMGKLDRQRPAAKQRTPGGAGPLAPPDPMQLVDVAVWAHGHGHEELFEEVIAALRTAPTGPLAGDLTSGLVRQVGSMWCRGWQPVDLHRVVARELGTREAGLLAGVVVRESQSWRSLGTEVAPRWVAQVDAMAAGTVHDLPDGGAPWVDLLVASVQLRSAIEQLPDLPLLEPPPSAWRTGMRTASSASGSRDVLDQVRALLAQAEGTDVDAEAEAFTVEAQERMARDRIDRAALVGGAPANDVVGRRLGIDGPYADAKAALLAGICAAHGTRAVWTEHAGSSTVFGFPAEVDAVEELFRSLLVQSTAALRREGAKKDRFGRSRTTRFRRAFLHAFARRVAGRSRQVADATLDADDRRTWLRPLLASRDAAVESAVAAAFPGMTSFGPPGYGDREEWVAETLFGDAADLGAGDLLEQRSAS